MFKNFGEDIERTVDYVNCFPVEKGWKRHMEHYANMAGILSEKYYFSGKLRQVSKQIHKAYRRLEYYSQETNVLIRKPKIEKGEDRFQPYGKVVENTIFLFYEPKASSKGKPRHFEVRILISIPIHWKIGYMDWVSKCGIGRFSLEDWGIYESDMFECEEKEGYRYLTFEELPESWQKAMRNDKSAYPLTWCNGVVRWPLFQTYVEIYDLDFGRFVFDGYYYLTNRWIEGIKGDNI